MEVCYSDVSKHEVVRMERKARLATMDTTDLCHEFAEAMEARDKASMAAVSHEFEMREYDRGRQCNSFLVA